MKTHSIICNRCRLVCVKFYLNRRRFTVVIAKCLGGSLFLGHSVFMHVSVNCIGDCGDVHTHNRFTALLEFVRDYPGEQVPER